MKVSFLGEMGGEYLFKHPHIWKSKVLTYKMPPDHIVKICTIEGQYSTLPYYLLEKHFTA